MIKFTLGCRSGFACELAKMRMQLRANPLHRQQRVLARDNLTFISQTFVLEEIPYIWLQMLHKNCYWSIEWTRFRYFNPNTRTFVRVTSDIKASKIKHQNAWTFQHCVLVHTRSILNFFTDASAANKRLHTCRYEKLPFLIKGSGGHTDTLWVKLRSDTFHVLAKGSRGRSLC